MAATHGSKSHHGLTKWLHNASSLKSFRTAFTHEHMNCKTGEGNDTANVRMLAAHEKEFACYDSCRESERYRTSVFLCLVYIHELTRNTYYNLNYRSEKRLKRLQNDSTMGLISFTKVALEAGAISFWLVYTSNITVCEALPLSEGEININKTSRSFFAAYLQAFREPGTIDWLPAADDMQLSSEEFLPQ